MATEYIGNPPLEAIIPVTLGCSRTFTVERINTDGDPQDWNADLHLSVELSRSQPTTTINATVSGSTATITIPSTVCDSTKNTSSAWQLVMVADNNPVAVMVGKFERHDS